MTRDQAIALLRSHEAELRARGVTALSLFGSIARGESTEESDVDVLVDIDPGAKFSLLDLSGVRLYLCDLFGREADVAIRKSLRPRFEERILADEVRVF